MKAIICTNYGVPEVLQIKEISKPIPRANEVLVKVCATTAHIGDTRVRRVDPFMVRLIFGLLKPKKNLVLGLESSGTIEEVGAEVTSFQKGDEVFAFSGFDFGAYAQYYCLPAKPRKGSIEKKGLVSLKPKNLSFEEAATIPSGGITVLKNFQKTQIKKGDTILINGASGSLGTYAIQLAKYYGATVTAVCSRKNFELVKSLGADKTIDYTQEDFTKDSVKYDIIYDAVMKSSRKECQSVLKESGIFINNTHLPKIEDNDLMFLKILIENEQLRPVIDRTYSFDEIVEAHRYVDTGHKRGNVVISMKSLMDDNI